MTYVLDGLLIAVLALCVWLGWRRGFIRTLSGLLALVAAVLVASLLAPPVADGIYYGGVEPSVTGVLEEHIDGNLLPTEEQLDGVLAKLPAFVNTLLDADGLGSGAAVLARMDAIKEGETAAQSITRQVVTPTVYPLIRMLCTLFLFLLAYVLVQILLRALDVVARLPFVKQMNQVLGLAAGAVSGVLWALFAAGVVLLVVQLGGFPGLTSSVVEDTRLLSWVSALLTK